MIAIGGSLGGYAALREILQRLPASFHLPIAVVLHRHRDSDGLLQRAVQSHCVLPVSEVEDKDPIQPGRVYLCPPDYHLMIDRACFSLSTDELVNHARPSIDVLFESAAEWGRQSAVAVVLTGSGSDGAEGASRIEHYGGIVLIQEPATAEGPWMPSAAIAATRSATVLPLPDIAAKLISLAAIKSASG